ncbi:MAG TPA: VOC family protein, partial [Gammaproteobacteria bacterium]|nr:VOC family protein [Gammaproteobacteria bacterium]
MSTDSMKLSGAFSWNELMTSDIVGAKAFYSALFGWQLNDMDTPMGSYTMAKVGETEVAGMMATPEEAAGAPPAWGAYVTVDDVDAMPAKIESLGGKVILPPQDIPDVGRFLVMQDPQGAMLMLI